MFSLTCAMAIFQLSNESTIYLDKVALESPLSKEIKATFGRNADGNSFRLNGKRFDRGIGMKGSSQADFDLMGKADRLRAIVGIDDSMKSGSATFRIVGDGKTLFSVPCKKTGGTSIDISVKGISRLQLISMSDGEDSRKTPLNWCDLSVSSTAELFSPRLLPVSEVASTQVQFTLQEQFNPGAERNLLVRFLQQQERQSATIQNNTTTAVWKMLVLFYPSTDSDYYTLENRKEHFSGSLDKETQNLVLAKLSEIQGFVYRKTAGMCRLVVDVKTINRPITVAENGNAVASGVCRLSGQAPFEKDWLIEKLQFNTPQKYDSTIVIFYPGPIPQDLGGAGGGGRNGTKAWVSCKGAEGWRPTDQGKLNTIFHEWTHGLDGFFGANGYSIEPLHHTYKFNRNPVNLQDEEFFAAIHQGTLLHGGDARYGYSRSVWMSGTPLRVNSLPPVQLLSPQPTATLPSDFVKLYWTQSKKYRNYEIVIRKLDGEPIPAFKAVTATNYVDLSGKLPAGEYEWYVLACDGDKKSAIGDIFRLSLTERTALQSVDFSSLRLSKLEVPSEGGQISAQLSARSVSGLHSVSVLVEQPDGHNQLIPLSRRTPAATDFVWEGQLRIGKYIGDRPRKFELKGVIIDRGNRTIHTASQLVTQSNLSPNARLEELKGTWVLTGFNASPVQDSVLKLAAKLENEKWENGGESWIELKRKDGFTDYLSLVGRGWDEGDWRTGFVAPRESLYNVPKCGVEFLRFFYKRGSSQFVVSSEIKLPPLALFLGNRGGFANQIPDSCKAPVIGSPLTGNRGVISAYSQDFAELKINKEIDGGKLRIGAKTYAQGIGTHSKSVIVIELPSGSKRFSGSAGVTPDKENIGSVVCAISSNSEVLFKSEPIRSGDQAVSFDVDVTGLKRVILWTGDANDGGGFDHTNWVNLSISF